MSLFLMIINIDLGFLTKKFRQDINFYLLRTFTHKNCKNLVDLSPLYIGSLIDL